MGALSNCTRGEMNKFQFGSFLGVQCVRACSLARSLAGVNTSARGPVTVCVRVALKGVVASSIHKTDNYTVRLTNRNRRARASDL